MTNLPLTAADIKAIRKAAAILRALDPHLEAAQSAGVAVDEQVARHHHLKTVADGMISVYSPLIEQQRQQPNG